MKHKRTFQPDIEFSGSAGFYTCFADTRKGESFLTEYMMFAPWQGSPHNGIAMDDTSYAQDIADGAIDCGLRVAVNGEPYRLTPPRPTRKGWWECSPTPHATPPHAEINANHLRIGRGE